MIKKEISQYSVAIIPEDSDDLLGLRRIIKLGDRVTADTTRSIKQEDEYSRPDKGKRVRIRIVLSAEKISLDNVLDRLRVGGTIVESNNESVSHGSHHSLVIKINDKITISKKRWSRVEKRLLAQGRNQASFILLAVDTSDCGIAKLKGTHLEMLANIYSGAGGKRYKTNFDIKKFFEQIQRAIIPIRIKSDIIVFGPGQTKNRLANFLQAQDGYTLQITEGIDSGGEDGIYTFTKSPIMREIMAGSKLARVSSVIDEIMMLANKKSKKFTMGLEETVKASMAGAVSILVFSDKSVQAYDEDRVIELLNSAEESGAETFSVDSTTDLGLRVTGLGGIVSLLRYAVEY